MFMYVLYAKEIIQTRYMYIIEVSYDTPCPAGLGGAFCKHICAYN